MSAAEVLAAKARLPQHVVYRAFVYETVVLNLRTGRYHGLNQTGGRMLEVLERSPSVREAARLLAVELARPVDEIECDVCEFCLDLLERDLIVLSVAGQSR